MDHLHWGEKTREETRCGDTSAYVKEGEVILSSAERETFIGAVIQTNYQTAVWNTIPQHPSMDVSLWH